MNYLFPEELRKFGFVPYEEWRATTLKASSRVWAVFTVHGDFVRTYTEDVTPEIHIAVQVAPVPCEKVKVWTYDRTSYGEVRLCRNRSTYTTLYDTMYKTDAQAQELCDLLERQEG